MACSLQISGFAFCESLSVLAAKPGHGSLRTMVVGDKVLRVPAKPARDDRASRIVALVVLAGCAVLVGWIASLGAVAPAN